MNKLVFDVGGTFIKYATMDMEGNILTHGEEKTPLESKEAFLETIIGIYNQHKDEVDGLAFSMPGSIDTDKGHIYTPGALTYNYDSDFFDFIHSRIDLPVSIENDGKCAALAEVWKGNLQDCQNGAVMVLGTGIGGGLVVNRQLLKGTHFFAGELSFVLENPMQPGMDSVFAMNGSATALCMKAARNMGVPFETLDGKKVFQAIKEGNQEALSALEEIAQHIAVQIFNTQCFIDPEVVCIGGGISRQELLHEKIKEKLDALYGGFPFPIPQVELRKCKYFNESNLVGALYNYKLHFGG